MQILVIGMHRSGTSMASRLLNMMGIYFAPEGMSTRPNEENPKGFWERRDVRRLNDMLLHGAGYDWDKIGGFSQERIPFGILQRFDTEARELILGMDAHRPWFIEEPRLCVLAPLWLKLMEFPICIFVYRSPLEVAASLKRRNGFETSLSLAMWEKYLVSALNTTRGIPRLVVRHSDLLKDPITVLGGLHSDLLEFGVRGIRLPSETEITAFVDAGLYRSRSDDPSQSRLLSPSQMELLNIFENDPRLLSCPELSVSASSVETLLAFERKPK